MLSIRPATVNDVSLMLALIRELAEYERQPEGTVVATEQDLARDGFGAEPRFRALIAAWDQQPAGYALFFPNYDTWHGRPGLFLEDLYVRPQFRGRGIGKSLLVEVARIACRENCYGVRWEVLNWNRPAIEFYKSLGGNILEEWLPVRVMGEELRRLAEAGA